MKKKELSKEKYCGNTYIKIDNNYYLFGILKLWGMFFIQKNIIFVTIF